MTQCVIVSTCYIVIVDCLLCPVAMAVMLMVHSLITVEFIELSVLSLREQFLSIPFSIELWKQNSETELLQHPVTADHYNTYSQGQRLAVVRSSETTIQNVRTTMKIIIVVRWTTMFF